MPRKRRDHIVEFLTEERIGETALAWLVAHFATFRGAFNVVTFLEKTLLQRLRKGPFVVEFYRRGDEPEPAYVTFNPLTLHTAREVWDAGEKGEEEATKILLHEAAHLIFHDQFAEEVTFTDTTVDRILSYPKERSGEWQAITFSEVAMRLIEELQRECPTDPAAAGWHRLSRRIQDSLGPLPQEYSGDACGECGNFTLVRNGTCLKCDTCGGTSRCS